MSLRIEVVDSTTRLMEIESDWRALAMRSGASVFQSHAWISTWWRWVSDRPGMRLRVAVAWSGGDLVGVLPFAIHRRKLLRTLHWAGEVFSDYCDALIDPRFETRSLLHALWGAVADAGGVDLASLRQVRPEARAALLFNQLRERYGQSELEQGARCFQIRRQWPDGNGFFRSLGKKGRNNHLRGKRILAKQTGGEVAFRTYAPGEDQRAVLDWLMALKRDWLQANDPASPLLGAEGMVLRALLDAMEQAHALTLFTIESGGQLAAASANFVSNGTNRAYVTAYDPAFSRASAGTMLIVEYTMWSFDRGLSEVDFLRGEETFKLSIANAETALSGIMAPCSLAGRAALAARGLRESARGAAQRRSEQFTHKPSPRRDSTQGSRRRSIMPDIRLDCSKTSRRTARGRNHLALTRLVADAILSVPDEAAEAALLDWLAAAQRPVIVSFVNQQALNLACAVPGYAKILEEADLLLRDGIGMRLCMAALGRSPGRNMNGTDLIPRLLETFAGRPVALYGTADPWISRAADVLERMGVSVVAVRDGFRHDSEYVADVLRNKPELVILAMGMPKQERVAAAIAEAVLDPIVIVNGGAVADFVGGRFPRAPEWMRRCGLEWLFRLGLEPVRLWRRYLLGGLAFGWRVARLWASSTLIGHSGHDRIGRKGDPNVPSVHRF